MQLPFPDRRSWFVPVRALVALAAVVVAGIATIGVAPAATTTKSFDAKIVQAKQNEYTFTLRNDATNTTLGSANVTVPAGFSAVEVAPRAMTSMGKTWTSVLTNGVIELRASTTKSALVPSEFLTVTITGVAGCAGSPYEWLTQVKQSNSFAGIPGNDFSGVSPSVSVIGPLATFAFATITSPKVVDETFNATVTAKDACGNPATFYTGSPALTGNLAEAGSKVPSYGTLSFAGANGVATAPVTAAKAQVGAKLTVADGSVAVDSNDFAVVSTVCSSNSGPCTASDPDGTTVTAPTPPSGGTTALSLINAPGQTFTCGETTYANVGSRVVVDPVYPPGETAPIQIAIEWSLVNATSGSRVICMTKDGRTFVVPKCGRTPVVPCELSRSRSGDILRATFLIAPADPGWSLG